MRRRYGIGFLVATLLVVLVLSIIDRNSYQRIQDEYEQEEKTRTQGNVETYYYIKENDGYVIVYEADQKTVYEYTTIRVEELPPKTQDAIKKGIKVDSLGQIYGFLENYSS